MNIFLGGPANGQSVIPQVREHHDVRYAVERLIPGRSGPRQELYNYTRLCLQVGSETYTFWVLAGTDLGSAHRMMVDALRRAGKGV